MKRVTLSLLSVALFAIATTSCTKKTTDPAPVLMNPIQILQSHTWKAKSILYEGQEMIEACQRDDIYTFKTDGTLLTNNRTLKCDSDEKNTETGLYVLSYDAKAISFNGIIGTVVTLIENTLVINTTCYNDTKTEITFVK